MLYNGEVTHNVSINRKRVTAPEEARKEVLVLRGNRLQRHLLFFHKLGARKLTRRIIFSMAKTLQSQELYYSRGDYFLNDYMITITVMVITCKTSVAEEAEQEISTVNMS